MKVSPVSVDEFQRALAIVSNAPPVGRELSFGGYTIVEDGFVRGCIALYNEFGAKRASAMQARISALISLAEVEGIAGIHMRDDPDGALLTSLPLLEVMASIRIHPKTREVDPAAVLAALAKRSL